MNDDDFTTVSLRRDTLKAVRVAAARAGYSSPELFLRAEYLEEVNYEI